MKIKLPSIIKVVLSCIVMILLTSFQINENKNKVVDEKTTSEIIVKNSTNTISSSRNNSKTETDTKTKTSNNNKKKETKSTPVIKKDDVTSTVKETIKIQETTDLEVTTETTEETTQAPTTQLQKVEEKVIETTVLEETTVIKSEPAVVEPTVVEQVVIDTAAVSQHSQYVETNEEALNNAYVFWINSLGFDPFVYVGYPNVIFNHSFNNGWVAVTDAAPYDQHYQNKLYDVTIYIDNNKIANYGCSLTQVVTHEMGHALGLYREGTGVMEQNCTKAVMRADANDVNEIIYRFNKLRFPPAPTTTPVETANIVIDLGVD